jgi:hypothetical protein
MLSPMSVLGRLSSTSRRQLSGLGLCLAGALALAACSSPAAKTTTSTRAAVNVPPPPAAESNADIKNAYKVLFDLANPAIAPKLAVVQDGQALKAAFTSALQSPFAKLAGGATVTSVTLESGHSCASRALPSPCADVEYTIVSPKNAVLLSGQKGLALWSGGHWLVGKATICGLLALESTSPPGCSA